MKKINKTWKIAFERVKAKESVYLEAKWMFDHDFRSFFLKDVVQKSGIY